MRTIRTIFATMLMGLTLAAFQFDAQAQTRRSAGGSSERSSRSSSVSRSSTSRSSSGTTRRQPSSTVNNHSSRRTPSSVGAADRPSAQTTRPSAQTSRPSGQVSRPSSQPTRPSGQTPRSSGRVTKRSPEKKSGSSAGPATSPGTRPSAPSGNRPAETRPDGGRRPGTVTRPGNRPGDRRPGGEAQRPDVRPGNNSGRGPGAAPGNPGRGQRPDRPVQIRPDHRPDAHRVHPRDRDFMHYDAPSYYWTGHNHCYGHRVRVLPTHVHRHVHYGVTYYCYNDIWYRPYGGYYVVCRPPFGTVLAANLIADMTWAAVRLSYYYTVANTYSQIDDNNRYIAEQNALIAQNNAIIASQNAQIAAGQPNAQAAYSLAVQLGLVQSYAAAGSNYYYQDGVFYVMDADGTYKVIVPPAGALVETLPEDYDMVVLSDGNEYYKVDDTIYKITISEGKPYFEVLGQLY